MSTDADLNKCVSPMYQVSTAGDGLQAEAAGDLALASIVAAPSYSCEPQKDSTDMDVDMEIDNDLTTSERMPTVAELEQPMDSKTKREKKRRRSRRTRRTRSHWRTAPCNRPAIRQPSKSRRRTSQ